MALLEKDAIRLGEALDDYELVHASDIGGTEEHGFWLMITDERFGLSYEIAIPMPITGTTSVTSPKATVARHPGSQRGGVMAPGTRTNCKRCGRDSDMTCPITRFLDELIEQLSHEGYEPHFNGR